MSSPPTNQRGEMGQAEEARFPDVGEVFEEKYRIEGLLGKGGYAKVYLATQIDLEREVAIKVLSPSVKNVEASQSNTGSVESLAIRFQREAKLVSQLRSPYTVTMHDYGRTAEDLLYMVLEYVDGITLDDADFPMEPRRISKILRQVLKSLHEAHDGGLLHRDLKPANIMLYEHLGEQDQVKLLDFGIAKLVGERHGDQARNEADLTGDATLLGTPRYMAPEQIRGEDVGPPRDIYSLGLIAYEMLVGQKAITEDDSIKIMAKHISAEPLEVPPGEFDTDLSKIVNRMLAKDVEARYDGVEDVLEDLQAYERGADIPGIETTAGDSSGAHASDVPESDADGSTAAGSEDDDSGSRLLIAAAAAILLVGGAAAFLVVQYGGSSEAQTQTIGSNGEKVAGADVEESEQTPTASTGTATPTEVEDTATGSSDAGETGPDAAPDVTVRVASTPRGAKIYVNDDYLGVAPVEFESGSYDFPVAVASEQNGDRRMVELEEPTDEVRFDFSVSVGADQGVTATDDEATDESGTTEDDSGGRANAEDPDSPEATSGSGASDPSGGAGGGDSSDESAGAGSGGNSDDSDQGSDGAGQQPASDDQQTGGGTDESGSDDSDEGGGTTFAPVE